MTVIIAASVKLVPGILITVITNLRVGTLFGNSQCSSALRSRE